MNEILEYFPHLTDKQIEQFKALQALYEDWNQKINVISRKDISNLYSHHVLHSLAMAKAINFNTLNSHFIPTLPYTAMVLTLR